MNNENLRITRIDAVDTHEVNMILGECHHRLISLSVSPRSLSLCDVGVSGMWGQVG